MKTLKPKELTWGVNFELESERKCHYYFRTNGDPDTDTVDIKKWITDLPEPFVNATFCYDVSFDDEGVAVTKTFDTMIANADKGDAIIVRDIMDIIFSREHILDLLGQFLIREIELYVIDYETSAYIEVNLKQLLPYILSETPEYCDLLTFDRFIKPFSEKYYNGKLIPKNERKFGNGK